MNFLTKSSRIIIIFTSLIIFINCENEKVDLINENVSVVKARDWFEKNKPSLKVLEYVKKIDWNKAIISDGTDGKVVEIPIVLNDDIEVKAKNDKSFKTYSRLMFIEKNKSISIYHVLISTYNVAFDNSDVNFNYYKLSTNFKGYITVLNSNNGLSGFSDFLHIKTNKPVITGKTKTEGVITCLYYGYWDENDEFHAYFEVGCYGGGSSSTSGTSYGSGGGKGTTEPVFVDKTPCEILIEKKANLEFKKKITDLNSKTGLKVESGYSEKLDGSFNALTISGSTLTTDGLNFAASTNTIGYLHTHLNDYETGKYNADGEVELRKVIRMFSPADIGQFLKLLENARVNNIAIDKIYGSMISSTRNYVLTFNGDINKVSSSFDWNSMTDDYKKYMESNNKEKAFLKFIKDKTGIEGITLSKLNSDGTVTIKTLDALAKIISTNCK